MISVRGLAKQFRTSESKVTALKGVDLDVAPGEFFVIVGASGSGKTTLLRCVAGLETAEAGEIRIGGDVVSSDNPPTWVPPQKRKLGMVFQSYAVWPHLTVYENVALPLTAGEQRVPRGEVEHRVQEALRMMQIDSLAKRSATLLSGGQQQRVALARAVAVNSKVLLMDEPLSNLDARLREEVRDAIRQLAKQLGSTVLYVTHDQVEAMAMADKIALMRLGELLQVGTPTELYRQPCRPEVAEFFGLVNWLHGTALDSGLVETPVGRLRVSKPVKQGEKLLLGFRPENLVLLPAQGGAGTASVDNQLDVRLTSSVFLGDQFVYQARVGEQQFVGKARSVPSLEGGVTVAIHPDDILVFTDVPALASTVPTTLFPDADTREEVQAESATPPIAV